MKKHCATQLQKNDAGFAFFCPFLRPGQGCTSGYFYIPLVSPLHRDPRLTTANRSAHCHFSLLRQARVRIVQWAFFRVIFSTTCQVKFPTAPAFLLRLVQRVFFSPLLPPHTFLDHFFFPSFFDQFFLLGCFPPLCFFVLLVVPPFVFSACDLLRGCVWWVRRPSFACLTLALHSHREIPPQRDVWSDSLRPLSAYGMSG